MPKPVILLAFANEREAGNKYLRNLPLELNSLKTVMEKAENMGLCELAVLPNATLDNLIATFQRAKYGYPDRPYRFMERYNPNDARIFFGRGCVKSQYF